MVLVRASQSAYMLESGAEATAEGYTASQIKSAVGAVEWLEDEDLIDVVTAVSGGGPAYVFLLIEALAKAGEAAGLPADIAMRLARGTVIATADGPVAVEDLVPGMEALTAEGRASWITWTATAPIATHK